MCSGQGEGLSLEEQKSKLAEARAKAEGALAKGDHCEAGCWLAQGTAGVRGMVLGHDRDGMHYWKLQAAEALGGDYTPTTQCLLLMLTCTKNHYMHNAD